MSFIDTYKEEILNLIEEFNTSKTPIIPKSIIRKISLNNNLNLNDTALKTLARNLKKFLIKENISFDSNNGYSAHEGLEKHCIERGIPTSNVSQYWDKTKEMSIQVKIDKSSIDYEEVIEDIVNNHITKPYKQIDSLNIASEKALNIILSDMHVGLEPNPNNNSIFEYEYNKEIFNNNLDKVYKSVIKEFNTHGRFDVIFLDDLGDGLDGYDSQTTRKNHYLDQNMSNTEQFKVYVEGKIKLIENLLKANITNKLIIRNVVNDNHAGSFASIANFTIKLILERAYNSSMFSFHILEKFIEHFEYGDHIFILTHGKDKKHMIKHFPLELTDSVIKIISEYVDHFEITSKYIHVFKGDLHRVNFNKCRKFDYRNFMSFAPPSAYVQHNFGASYSGYSIQVIPKHSNEISNTDYFFDLKKIKYENDFIIN